MGNSADPVVKSPLWLQILLPVVLILTGCTSVPPPELRRALVEVDDVQAAIDLECALNAREGQTPPQGASWFEVHRGSVPVIVTAPHSTRPFREGRYRFSDGGGTAGLAQALHLRCGVTAIYTTYEGPSDPNYYDDNDFKVALAAELAVRPAMLVLDVHGSHPFRPYDVDLGTMSNRSVAVDPTVVADLNEALRAEGLVNVSLDRFAGSKYATVIKFASARGVPAV